MEVTLMRNGVKIGNAEIDEAKLQELSNKNDFQSSYERVTLGGVYYYIADDNNIVQSIDMATVRDDTRFNSGNYYNNEIVAKSRARADQLLRKLRRFADENNRGCLRWDTPFIANYYITFNHEANKLEINDSVIEQGFGIVYFRSREIAKLAMGIFHDELMWYFTTIV